MRRKTFVSPAQAGPGGGEIEWITLDHGAESDREWLAQRGDLGAYVEAWMGDTPQHNECIHHGSSIMLCLVRSKLENDERIGFKILIDPTRVVAVCYGTASIAEDVLSRYEETGSSTTVYRLLPLLVTALVKPLEQEITRFSDAIDGLEDLVMKEDDESYTDVGAVIRIGRDLLSLRRHLTPMRDELSFLAYNPEDLPGAADTRFLRRSVEYLGRLVESLDSSQQRVNLLLTQLRNRDETRLSHSMYKLSMVATVFLPLSFVTGLLGINVAGIPESHDPFGFWLVCAFLIAVAVIAWLLIRWKRWL